MSVNGDSEKIYDDVWWFLSMSKSFNYFPKKIQKFFPNVEFLWLASQDIATLTQADLRPFGSLLKTLYFNGNKIEVIDADLFDENPNLEVIYLNANLINSVASEAFDKLEKLSTLYFNGNPCHPAGNAKNDRTAVLSLVKEIEGNCQAHQLTTKPPKTSKTTKEPKTTKTTKKPRKVEEVTANPQPQAELEKFKVQSQNCLDLNENLRQKYSDYSAIKEENENLKVKLEEGQNCNPSTQEPSQEIFQILNEINAKLDRTNAKFNSLEAKLIAVEASLQNNKESIEKKIDSICSGLNNKGVDNVKKDVEFNNYDDWEMQTSVRPRRA